MMRACSPCLTRIMHSARIRGQSRNGHARTERATPALAPTGGAWHARPFGGLPTKYSITGK